jgi:hypothetical protein
MHLYTLQGIVVTKPSQRALISSRDPHKGYCQLAEKRNLWHTDGMKTNITAPNYKGFRFPVLATYHIRRINQAFKSTFTYLSQLADFPEEEYNRQAFICSSS